MTTWEVYNNESQQITSVTIGNFKASIVYNTTLQKSKSGKVKVKGINKSYPYNRPWRSMGL
jgi:hypothetical protein